MGIAQQLSWRSALRSKLVKTVGQPIHCNHRVLKRRPGPPEKESHRSWEHIAKLALLTGPELCKKISDEEENMPSTHTNTEDLEDESNETLALDKVLQEPNDYWEEELFFPRDECSHWLSKTGPH